jgi:dienelactone hydrolase
MSNRTIRLLVAIAYALVLIALPAFAEPTTSTVSLTAPDGTALKATYYTPGQPGPGLVLLHQCNRDRSAWAAFGQAAAARGYHVIAMDYRGYGESGGERFEDFQQQGPVVAEKWPGDVDMAFKWLISQQGVDRNRIAAAGASCGVNQSVLLASRHPEVKTVMLLSGGVTPPGRAYLNGSPWLPVFAAASHDDGGAVEGMRWILGWSRNKANTLVEYKAAGHGTDMFAVEKGLQPKMLDWLDAHLRNAPTTPPASSAAAAPSPVEVFWTTLGEPGGPAKARKIFDDARRANSKVILFPEGELNLFGYDLLQRGKAEDAVIVFMMNVDAYPESANTYDSLSDAYLAAGKRDEALKFAEKALKVLATDTRTPEDFKTRIRESAEGKVAQLKKSASVKW